MNNNGVNNQNTNTVANNTNTTIQNNTPQVNSTTSVVSTPKVQAEPKPQNQSAPQQTTNIPPTTTNIQATPVIQNNTQKEEKPKIDLSNHPQNIINGTKDDQYQASSANLNSIEQPINQKEEYIPQPEDMKMANNEEYDEQPVRKKSKLIPILFLIILGLGGYIFYTTKNYQSKISELKYNCTPVTSYKEEKELDTKSTLVQDLYSKVYTNIREDIAQPEWDDNMKLYLAYRQIPEHNKYESNCNMFNPSLMEPYTCTESNDFTPHAFKEEKLVIEWKKLFGEETPINLQNIKLKNSCIGGYEYIQERGEYVEGYCDIQNATSYKMEKSLTKATTYRNTIILTEKVKYHPNERQDLPEYLKSGEYIYTFRLDMNYNYILVSKVYNDKYNN